MVAMVISTYQVKVKTKKGNKKGELGLNPSWLESNRLLASDLSALIFSPV